MEDEIITTDVPETSENEELEEVVIDTSEDNKPEQTQETQENEPKDEVRYTQEEVNSMIKDRLDRFKKKEKENLRKYEYLESIVKTGTGTNNLDDAIRETVDFYKGNGLEIPEFNSLSEEDEIALGRSDASGYLNLDYDEIKDEANRLANIPREQRTLRQQEKLHVLGVELTKRDNIKKMKDKGYDSDVLNTTEFIKFSNQFNSDTDISKIYEMYQKVNGLEPKKPDSPGSAKGNNSSTLIKEYYTPEEARKFTEEDLERNPKLLEAIERSMLQWK